MEVYKANRKLDLAVRTQHNDDRYRMEWLLDYLACAPPKKEAMYMLQRFVDRIRRETLERPELANEIWTRRVLAAKGGR